MHYRRSTFWGNQFPEHAPGLIKLCVRCGVGKEAVVLVGDTAEVSVCELVSSCISIKAAAVQLMDCDVRAGISP